MSQQTPRTDALAKGLLRGAQMEELARQLELECGRLRTVSEGLVEALENIAGVCNGYGDEAGWACRHARAALAKTKGEAR